MGWAVMRASTRGWIQDRESWEVDPRGTPFVVQFRDLSVWVCSCGGGQGKEWMTVAAQAGSLGGICRWDVVVC